jgi:hypothetical protein
MDVDALCRMSANLDSADPGREKKVITAYNYECLTQWTLTMGSARP